MTLGYQTRSSDSLNVSLPQLGAGECSVDVVSSTEDFDKLELEWNLLLEGCSSSIFQSFEWQRTWWKHFGERDVHTYLHIVTVRMDGRLIAIAPFLIESIQILKPLRFRRLAFLGREISDYLDMIVARGYEKLSIKHVASHLAEHSTLFDVIHLQDMPARSPSAPLLHEALTRAQFHGTLFINDVCPRTQLLDSWEATLATFSSSRRSDISRRLRKITREYEIVFEVAGRRDNLKSDMNEFIDMHQQTWQSRGYEGVFADARQIAFHHEIAQILHNRGWLVLAFLRLNEQRIAANYLFHYGNEIFQYQSALREASNVSKLSPGRVLHALCMQEAIKRGARVYDFMRGNEEHKYRFEAVDVPNWTLLLYPKGSRTATLQFKSHLLAQALHRRVVRERLLYRQVVKRAGLLSLTVGRHIMKRVLITFRQGLQKARAPEKQLGTIGKNGQT